MKKRLCLTVLYNLIIYIKCSISHTEMEEDEEEREEEEEEKKKEEEEEKKEEEDNNDNNNSCELQCNCK